ncbi:calphotin-like, partial [Penaeus indicus]|uniref:calphotin-like n=1 Tax=Penaeus indicus TaxID=29960 RepID=UPI00300C6430
VLVVAAVVGVAAARTIFDYERDGLDNEQKGQPGKAVAGEYEWRAPDGKVVEISYVADHLGFRLVDDPEPTATQSGAARSLGEEEDDDGGAREVRTEEETEEEEGEEESEGRSEGTEEEESESSGKERSEEPETEGAEAEEKSAEPEAEEAEEEEEEQEPETKAAEAGEKSAEAEQEKADAEAEENAGAEGATKKASEESADAEADQEASTASADEVEAKISSDGEAVAAEVEAPEGGGMSAGKQLSPETPVLVPVKVESNFDSVSPATEAPVIATAEMLPPVAPLVAPMTVESPPAPVPTAEFSFDAAHSEPVNLVPQDLVVFVIPPVEQVATLPVDVSQPMPAAAPFASAASALPVEIPQPAFTDSDFVFTEQGSADPVLLLPELPLALVASPEGTNVVLEKPVVEKLEVSAPIGVPEIDADIAVIAKSSDSFQAAPQFIATDLSGSFDPVADIPASLSVIPASDTAFVPVENFPKTISFEEVVEVSPEVALAPELPSPLPLIQLDEVDPSFVSVEISAAALPQPDTIPSSLFSADVEVRPEPQFIAPILPPPAPLSQDASFALPPHRFEVPKSGRSMDSVPVFVETSQAEPTNALFFVPEALQEETKGQSSDMIEIVVPADSIMTIAKSLTQPAPTSAEPIVYEETAEPLLAQLEFGPAPSPAGAEASALQGSASFANAIPLSLKDETFFSAVDASPVTFDASPVEVAFIEVPAEDSFPVLSEAVAQPLTEPQPGVHSAFEEPVLVDVSAAADVQGPEVSPPAVAIFETDAGLEPIFEEVVMISEEPAAAGPNAQVTIITEDVPSGPLDYDDATVLVSKSIQSPPLLPPLMKPSVILN